MMSSDGQTASCGVPETPALVCRPTCPGVPRARAFYSDIRRLEGASDVVPGAAAARAGRRQQEEPQVAPAPTLLIFGGCNPQSLGGVVEPAHPTGMTLDPADHSREAAPLRFASCLRFPRLARSTSSRTLPASAVAGRPQGRGQRATRARTFLQSVRAQSAEFSHE